MKKNLINFVDIPNVMILGENSLIKKYGDKALLVYIYLQRNKTIRSTVQFSLKDLIEESGYTTCRTKGKSNDEFKKILQFFSENKIIEVNHNLSLVKVSDFIKCSFKEIIEESFILYDSEIDKILKSNYKVKSLSLLKIYSSIKARKFNDITLCDLNEIAYDSGIKKKQIIKEGINILKNNLELLNK